MNLDWIKVLPSKETPFNKEFFEKLSTSILDYAFPIGKTEIFYDAEDHSNYLGFKWEMVCIGKTPVGIDSNDADFNTIGKTGGSKELQNHNHIGLFYTGSGNKKLTLNTGSEAGYALEMQANKAVTYNDIKTAATGAGDSGNLQPYEVVAYWKRVE